MAYRMSAKTEKFDDHELQKKPADVIKEYKNENVLFKIHTQHGEQDFNGKKFPAKFSINISNSGGSAIPSLKTDLEGTHRDYNSPNKTKSPKNLRASENDFDYNERCLREHQQEYENLAREANETVARYEEYIEELENELKSRKQENRDLNSQNLKLELIYMEKLKKQQEAMEGVRRKLESEQKKLKKKLGGATKSISDLEEKVKELEKVISQKEELIKQISILNNQVYQKMMENQETASTAQITNMDKWLKNLNKVMAKGNTQKDNESQALLEMMRRYEEMEKLALRLEENKEELREECKILKKQKEAAQKAYENLKMDFLSIEQKLHEKEKLKESEWKRNTEETFSKRTDYEDGTVRVRMDFLLLEKDRRIESLENELLQIQRENLGFKTKFAKAQNMQCLHLEPSWENNPYAKYGGKKEERAMLTSLIARSKSMDNFHPKQSQFIEGEDEDGGKDKRMKELYQTIHQQYTKFSNTLSKLIENSSQVPSKRFHKAPSGNFPTFGEFREDREASETESVTYSYHNNREEARARAQMKRTSDEYSSLAQEASTCQIYRIRSSDEGESNIHGSSGEKSKKYYTMGQNKRVIRGHRMDGF